MSDGCRLAESPAYLSTLQKALRPAYLGLARASGFRYHSGVASLTWKTILFGFLKGIIAVLSEEYEILARARATPKRKKEAPAPEPTMGWGPPSEPPPVTAIRIETEEGTRVAAASFVGSEYFGCKRVEKERLPGESRRTRRIRRETRTDVVPAASTMPTMATSEPSTMVTATRRTRRGPPLTQLSQSTLMTLARGEAFVAA